MGTCCLNFAVFCMRFIINLYFRQQLNAAFWESVVPHMWWMMTAVMWKEELARHLLQKRYHRLHPVRKAHWEGAATRILHQKSPFPQRSVGWLLIKTPGRPCCNELHVWATRYLHASMCHVAHEFDSSKTYSTLKHDVFYLFIYTYIFLLFY